jgi:hypothetical protein
VESCVQEYVPGLGLPLARICIKLGLLRLREIGGGAKNRTGITQAAVPTPSVIEPSDVTGASDTLKLIWVSEVTVALLDWRKLTPPFPLHDTCGVLPEKPLPPITAELFPGPHGGEGTGHTVICAGGGGGVDST